MNPKTELFSNLMRELEVDVGTRDLTELILRSLIDAIRGFKGSKFNNFCKQYHEFAEMVTNTEPKFGIFRYYFGYLEKEISGGICSITDDKKWKKHAIRKIEEVLKTGRKLKRNLIKYSDELKIDGKTILIHDHSHTVQDVLVHYKSRNKKFKVIIAEQDYEKTHDNIERLHKAGINFTVVPAYMLSHVHDQIDMVFFGALTLKDTMDFVLNPGALSLITEFHSEKIPVYMFLGIDKFSLWKSKRRSEIFIHKHKRQHAHKPIEYDRIKYSHDRVPSKFFKKIVTNEGVLTPAKLKKVYKEKFKNLK